MLGFKKIFSVFVVVILTASCMSFTSGGSQSFDLRLLEAKNDLCLFQEINGVDRARYLLSSGKCEWNRGLRDELMLVDKGVDLNLDEFKVAFAYLAEYNVEQCDKLKNVQFSLCLKGSKPNAVTRDRGDYVFWYGRFAGNDLGGFPIALRKSSSGFTIAPSDK